MRHENRGSGRFWPAFAPAAYATNAWYGSDAYQQTFLSAWGAS